MNVHESVYRSLTVVLPKAHRREYGEPMVQLVRDRFRDEGGGMHSMTLWGQIVWDLARTALSERTEMTMDTLKQGWWRLAAGLISTAIAVAAVGNLFGSWIDDGPRYGKIGASVATVVAAAVVFGGMAIRRRQRAGGSVMIGVGVLPAVLLITVPWFPLLAALGVLAAVVVFMAFLDAATGSPTQPADVAR
jgi:hypothetical protein